MLQIWLVPRSTFQANSSVVCSGEISVATHITSHSTKCSVTSSVAYDSVGLWSQFITRLCWRKKHDKQEAYLFNEFLWCWLQQRQDHPKTKRHLFLHQSFDQALKPDHVILYSFSESDTWAFKLCSKNAHEIQHGCQLSYIAQTDKQYSFEFFSTPGNYLQAHLRLTSLLFKREQRAKTGNNHTKSDVLPFGLPQVFLCVL